MLIHPVNTNYVNMANQLVARPDSIVKIFKTNSNQTAIDIEFVDHNDGTCIVLIKNGLVIIKTFIPMQK